MGGGAAAAGGIGPRTEEGARKSRPCRTGIAAGWEEGTHKGHPYGMRLTPRIGSGGAASGVGDGDGSDWGAWGLR